MKTEKQRGITLIAVVVTVVVLIILAAVSISALGGDKGIANQSKEAKDETEISEEKEILQISAISAIGKNKIGELTYENLKEELDKNIEDGNYILSIVGDKFKVTFVKSGRSYLIDQDGNITQELEETGEETGEDTEGPIVNIVAKSVTSNSITVKITATDNGSGMSASPTYTYYIKKTIESDTEYVQTESSTNASYVFSGLEQNTSYDIKVTTTDILGNEGEGILLNKSTGEVTSGLEQGAITFSNVTWSAGIATVSINTNTSYTIQYQKNSISGIWTTIQNGGTISSLTHGDTIYARLTDGINSGEYASVNIIDNIVPIINNITTSDITLSSIKLTITATDAQSGLASSGTYKYYLNGTLKETTTNNNYTYTGLTVGTEYTLKVEVIDKAGNAITSTTTDTTLAIGDYINYTPQTSVFSYTFESKYTGYTSDQTIMQENLRWKLLDIKEDGTVELIAETPTTNQVYLTGALGYNNGVYLLNDFCKTLYSNSSNEAVARSVKIEDIEDKLDLTVWDYHDYKNIVQYGDYKELSGNRTSTLYVVDKYYPWQWSQENSENNKLGTESTNGTLGGSEQYELTTQTSLKVTTTTITATETTWCSDSLTADNFKEEIMYELLNKNKYWIASRITNISTGETLETGLHQYSSNTINWATLFESSHPINNGNGPFDSECSNYILPIVTLPASNIEKMQ